MGYVNWLWASVFSFREWGPSLQGPNLRTTYSSLARVLTHPSHSSVDDYDKNTNTNINKTDSEKTKDQKRIFANKQLDDFKTLKNPAATGIGMQHATLKRLQTSMCEPHQP